MNYAKLSWSGGKIKDKSPFHTNVAAHFRRAEGKHVAAPFFYVHLEPGDVFAGFGMWRPEPPTLAKLREAIAKRSTQWLRIVCGPAFATKLTLHGDSLSRPPSGYRADHPCIDDLKRKSFVAIANFSEKEACSADFIDRYDEACRAALPFMRFLTAAVRLTW